MRPGKLTFVLATSAIHASAQSLLPTFTSTIISTSCSKSSTRAYYGNSTSSESDSYLYETDYITNQDTITMLQTVCSNDDCYITTILNTLATVVTTVDGILTTYVTASPLTVIYNDEHTSTISSVEATARPEAITTDLPISTAISAIGTTVKTKPFSGSIYSANALESGSAIVTSIPSASAHTESLSGEIPLEPSSGISTDLSQVVTPVTKTKDLDKTFQASQVTIVDCFSGLCQALSVNSGVTAIPSTSFESQATHTSESDITEEGAVHSSLTKSDSNVESNSTQTWAVTSAPVTDVSSALQAPTKAVSSISSTVLTVTSCDALYKCSKTSITTGVSYYITTVSGTETMLTTYCPLSEVNSSISEFDSPAVHATDINVAKSSNLIDTVTNTVNVITNNIITQLPQSASTGSVATTSVSTGIVTTYEAGASRVLPLFVALPVIYLII